MNGLPPGWTLSTIGDVADYVQRGRGPTYAPVSNLPIINQKCIRWHGVEAEHIKFVDEKTRDQWSSDRVLRSGDVLWNSTGTGTLGRAALFTGLPGFDDVVVDSHVTIVRVTASEPKYVHYWIRSPTIQGRLEQMQAGSTNQVELPRAEVIATELPLAPLNEQRRIVAKLDAVFEQTRAAKARLERLPALLEKLKRSILAAAFRGDLSTDWRAAQAEVEPASVRLDHIRADRRCRWEDALRAKGKDPKKATYEEPASLDLVDLPALPTGWTWAPLELLLRSGGLAYGVLKPGGHVPNGVPMLRVMDFNDNGELTGTEIARISSDLHAEFSRTRLEVDDVLLSVMATIGRTMVVPNELAGGNVNRAIAVLKPLSIALRSDFLVGVFRSPHFREQVVEQTLGTAQPRINLGDVARFPVPVPPLAEQAEIERRLSQMIGAVRSRQISLEHAAKRMSRLEHAALAKAFRGELVPQDPNDEPASVLLHRILAARAAEPERARRDRAPRREGAAVIEAASTAASNGHSKNDHHDESLDLVAGVFQIDRRLTVTAIADATGLDTSTVRTALKLLVAGGQVRVRRAAYEWCA